MQSLSFKIIPINLIALYYLINYFNRIIAYVGSSDHIQQITYMYKEKLTVVLKFINFIFYAKLFFETVYII